MNILIKCLPFTNELIILRGAILPLIPNKFKIEAPTRALVDATTSCIGMLAHQFKIDDLLHIKTTNLLLTSGKEYNGRNQFLTGLSAMQNFVKLIRNNNGEYSLLINDSIFSSIVLMCISLYSKYSIFGIIISLFKKGLIKTVSNVFRKIVKDESSINNKNIIDDNFFRSFDSNGDVVYIRKPKTRVIPDSQF